MGCKARYHFKPYQSPDDDNQSELSGFRPGTCSKRKLPLELAVPVNTTKKRKLSALTHRYKFEFGTPRTGIGFATQTIQNFSAELFSLSYTQIVDIDSAHPHLGAGIAFLILIMTLSSATLPSLPDMSATEQSAAEAWYTCPVCDMKNDDSIYSHSPEKALESPHSSSQQTHSWPCPSPFHAHFVTHLRLFQRTNSSEYYCLLCPCGHVMGKPCSSRFSTAGAFLKHVTEAHSKPSELRRSFQHYCAPLSDDSYTPEILEELKKETDDTQKRSFEFS